MKQVLLGWVLVLGLVLPAWAIEPVGSVAGAFGKISLLRNGKTYPAAQGLKLYAGDSISAANDSFAKLLLNDDSLLTVGENSTFKIEGLKNDATSRFGQFRLMFGKVRAIVSKFGAGKTDYRFMTPTAVAGVRGTHLVVEFDAATQQTTLSVVEGSVGFKSLDGATSGGEVIVGAQQRSEQKAGAPAGQPQQMSADQLKQLDSEISQQTPATEDEGTSGGTKGDQPAGSGTGSDPKDESQPSDPEGRIDDKLDRIEQTVEGTTNSNPQENPAVNPATQTGVRVRW